jgi:hypothetical protein
VVVTIKSELRHKKWAISGTISAAVPNQVIRIWNELSWLRVIDSRCIIMPVVAVLSTHSSFFLCILIALKRHSLLPVQFTRVYALSSSTI